MQNTLILSVKGKNIENFIRKIHKRNIEILSIKNISYNEVEIEVYDKDYEDIIKIKTIYEINIKEYKGIKNIKNKIIFNRNILISLFLGIILFTFLSNIIFEVEVSYSELKIRNLLYRELEEYGIKKYSFVKSYNEVEKIKAKIIENNKDTIEWLDIKRVGIKYIVKVEPRKINKIVEDDKIYNVVSGKDAIIKSIESSSGEIIKNINDYVKKGDIVISSNITLNGEVKNKVSARGTIYGEVWYQVQIEYPLDYYEEKETGNKKEVYNLRIINKDYNFSKLKNIKKEDKIILKSDILPIIFSKQTQKEIEIINYQLTKEEAIEKAKESAREKIKANLDGKEYIMDEKCLKIDIKDSKIVLDIFYTVYEDITNYVEIEIEG